MAKPVVYSISGTISLTVKDGESIYDAWKRCCEALEADKAVSDVDLDIEEL